MAFESQNRKRPLRAVPLNGGRVVFLSEQNRDPSYWDGYNDALDGLDFSWTLLGGTTLEAEEYRAGYLQGCADHCIGETTRPVLKPSYEDDLRWEDPAAMSDDEPSGGPV